MRDRSSRLLESGTSHSAFLLAHYIIRELATRVLRESIGEPSVRRICTRDARVVVISISGHHRKRAGRALIGNFAPITDAPLKYRHGERDRARSLARPPALDT